MKRRNYFKFLAVILALVMLFTYLPTYAITPSETTATTEPIESPTTETNETEPVLVSSGSFVSDEIIEGITELDALRQENVKHFKLTDGTYKMIVYGSPVHRQNSDGEWKDIDNNLSLTTANGTQIYSTSDSRAVFAQRYSPNTPLYALNENGYSISMSFVNNRISTGNVSTYAIDSVPAPIITNATTRAENGSWATLEEAAKIDNTSTITYSNVKANTDIEYVLAGNKIKENIIVKAPSSSYVYEFTLNLTGLTAALDEYGNIRIADSVTKESKYVIPAPYMYDANGEMSYDASYALQALLNGRYKITVTANAEWINSTERAFPVVIDPTLIPNAGVLDTFVTSREPTTNFGSWSTMGVDSKSIALILLGVQGLPAGATYNGADLNVSYLYSLGSSQVTLGAYSILESWDQYTVTWNTKPDIATSPLSTTVFQSCMVVSQKSFDITEPVRSWLNNSSQNYGIAIKYLSSDTSTAVPLYTYENGSGYPYLSINYTYVIPDGVYGFKNGIYDRWLSVEGNGLYYTSKAQHVGFSDLTVTPVSEFNRNALFKITHVAEDRYIIRWMTNNNLTFRINSDGYVVGKPIPPDDNDVLISDTIHIEWDGRGFLLRPYNSNLIFKMQSASDLDIIAVEKNNVLSSSRWSLLQYTGQHQYGHSAYVAAQGVLYVGRWNAFIIMVWSTMINANEPYIAIAPECLKYVSGEWDAINHQLKVTAQKSGYYIVSFQLLNANERIELDIYEESIHSINNGVYYMINRSSDLTMQINNGTSLAERHVFASYFRGNPYQRWVAVHINRGYYCIRNIDSGLALTLPHSSIGTTGYLTKEHYTGLDNQLWKIDKSTSGYYVIRSKAAENLASEWCVGINGRLTANRVYNDDSNYIDEWLLITEYESAIITLPDQEDVHRTTYQKDILPKIVELGYDNYYNNQAIIEKGTSKNEVLAYMSSSKIFILYTHGSPTSVTVRNGMLETVDILNLSTRALENSELIIYISCSTAQGRENNPNNIVNVTHSRGAEVVIGFSENIWADHATGWVTHFFSALVVGKTVEEAALYANGVIGEHLSTNSYYIAGNKQKKFV